MRWPWLCVILVACGGKKQPPLGDRVSAQYMIVGDAIARGAIDEAEAALAELEQLTKGTEFPPPTDMRYQIAELYWSEAKEGPQRTIGVFETVKKGNDCSSVGQVLSSPDPAALAKLHDHLVRARELYRGACDWWGAADVSSFLGDLDGVEADLAAGHAQESHIDGCTSTTIGPSDNRDYLPVRMALAAGDAPRARRAAEQALAWAPAMEYSWPAVYACRTHVVLGWLAEQAHDLAQARREYEAAGVDPPETDDDCFATAEARRAALKDADPAKPPALTHVTASTLVPPGSTVRLAFIAQPPTPPDRTPALFGNKMGGLHTFGLRRDQYFFVDAVSDEPGQFEADLPPGTWLAQVEIEPAADWRLGDICWPVLEPRGKPVGLGIFDFVHQTP